MIVLKVKIYANGQIIIPNCCVLLDIVRLSNPAMFIVLGLDLQISIHIKDNGN